MRTAATVLLTVILVGGVLQLGLGVSFWTGAGAGLVPVHMLLGTLLVLSLWALSALALIARTPTGPAIAGFVLGAVVLAYGMTQERVLPGSLHWIAQVLHLLFGLSLIGLGLRLGFSIRARTQSRIPSAT